MMILSPPTNKSGSLSVKSYKIFKLDEFSNTLYGYGHAKNCNNCYMIVTGADTDFRLREGRKLGSTVVARIETPRRWGRSSAPPQENVRVLIVKLAYCGEF
jgi:hypothetical protein